MKWLKRFFLFFVGLVFFAIVFVLTINFYVTLSVQDKILENPNDSFDAILVLGCQVNPNQEPSKMLKDRLETALGLYQNGVASKIIVSGDHRTPYYNEVKVMKNFLIEHEVPSDAIFMDHAGFSTYESVYRSKAIFEAKKVVIVSQKYHLYRALYVAKSLGIEAFGVASNGNSYQGQIYREIREIMARNKDFAISIFQPEPTYLGESIPVSGNGDDTNDINYQKFAY